jgi:hypothetical protein
VSFNPLNAKLNPICHLLAMLGAHPILHVIMIGVELAAGCVLCETRSDIEDRAENQNVKIATGCLVHS